MREEFRTDLETVSRLLVEMAEAVRVAMRTATRALLTADRLAAETVIARDAEVDSLYRQTEELVCDLLARQALELGVEVVAVARASAAQDLQLAFYAAAKAGGYDAGDHPVPKILAGPDAATELAGEPCDVVLNGMTGSIGLAPTLAALHAGRTLALANKESLVAGGPLVQAARQRPDQIVPVDSEHSALAQCLRGGSATESDLGRVTGLADTIIGLATEFIHANLSQPLRLDTASVS